MKHAIKQRGFTLIELLVVVAIMGVFMGLVAISNRPSRKTQLRQAAQSVASLVIATQSNALESDVGSALWISDDGIYDANPQQNDRLTLASVSNVQATTCQLNGLTVPSDACRVRFVSNTSDTQPPSPWFDINVNTRIASFQTPAQTQYNTIWPARFYSNPVAPQCDAEFDLEPLRAGLAYQWPKLAKIDWRYSGVGSTGLLQADAVVVFERGGKIEAYFTGMSSSVSSVPAMSTIYLCIAYAPDVEALAATLASEDTVWVAIEPNTGRASLGWNVPTALNSISTPTSTELAGARANVVAGRGLAN
jgi:prepilin-type N-terminal cleavage/methylation domain-containing protein